MQPLTGVLEHAFSSSEEETRIQTGIYSDDIFKEQNKLLESKISSVQAAKSDAVIEKYNLKAITKFVQAKFINLNGTFTSALLKQKKC